MDVFEYAKLRELYSKVYAPSNEEVVDQEVQEETSEELDENARVELERIQKDAAEKRRQAQYKAGGGDAKVKEFTDQGYTQGQARRATMNQGGTNQRKAKEKANDPNTQALKDLIDKKKPAETKTKPPAEKPPAEKPPAGPPAAPASSAPASSRPSGPAAPAAPAKNRMASASKADRMAAWAKANKGMIQKSGTSKQKSILKKSTAPTTATGGAPAPTAPKPETKPAPTAKPSPAAKPMSRIAKATSNVKPYKPMKEDFDIIFDHLVESGFGPDEALRIMVEMPEDKRQQILEKELSVDDQMRVSKEYNRMSPEEKKEANKKAMGDRPKAEPKKDERTDDEKMTDATGPRKGSNYRGD